MNRWLYWMIVGIGVVLAEPVEAQSITWNDSVRLGLAQCLVGEAGWTNRTEHSAIAHVLERRARWAQRRRPGSTFEDMVRRYCSVHRVADPNPRQRWIRALTWGPLTADPGMDEEWTNFIEDYDYLRETVRMFEAGELTDPLPRAAHWGGPMDSPPLGGVALTRSVRGLDGSGVISLRNIFYRIDPELLRQAREPARLDPNGTGTVPANLARGRRRS